MGVSCKRWGLLLAICLGMLAPPAAVYAACDPAPGTVITKSNWQQYKDCFSEGVQHFWEGDLFWKMPDDVEIHVGPEHTWTLPKPFVEATEKYGGQTRLEKQADGRYKLVNYVAGVPFPNPSGPDKGTEIMANDTYKFQGYLVAVALELGNQGAFYTKDRFGNFSPEVVDATYRQLAYNWEPDQPRVDPQAAGAWYSEWIMVEQPEQSKYTAVLTLFWQDNLKDEDDYAFVPALRRSLRLSSSARCAPLLGSDMVKDDQRVGWNGGVGKFEGTWLRDQKILTLVNMNPKAPGNFPAEYDGTLGWPKPSWGNWETREASVVDVRRIPSLAPGYCYGKRVDYVDKQYYGNIAEDIYDSNMKLWKVMWVASTPTQLDNYGEQSGVCGIVENYWDVQNDHVSYITSFNPKGACSLWDKQVPSQWNNINKYASPSGLMQLMR
ncbi:MAG TPA: DUF1329 domain-containing protein [Candidatus Binataceae bacterium]|nr:DUF1329 domain-containing protein [Candidatus Binataceae bacterium]